jgi:predicted phosphodiesterase
MKKVKLAIVSDLHCHPKRDVEKEGVNCTYLFADILRNHDHPIENLINLLKSEEVDYILCPGDITDKCNTQGFIGGWNYLLELKEHFKAKKIIATVGNHDVDSRGNNDSYSYSNVKGIKKNYPFENNGDKIIEEFYANGYTIIEENEIIFLVIDSCFYHHNKEESPKGKILIDTINEIENKVKELDEEKYKILLLHHHPIEHTRKDLGEEDVLKNGKELVEMISNYNFDLIIHGHKHDPWLRLENNITILSSGSFSSTSNFQFTSDRNRFHIVELNEKSKRTNKNMDLFAI